MLDKKTYGLLKYFYKHAYLSYKQIDIFTKSQTPKNGLNDTALHLSSKGLVLRHFSGQTIKGVPIYDGYVISSEGRAYVEDHRRQLLMFVLPYGLTTFIALLSLFTTIATNWDKIFYFLSTISQNSH